MGPYLIPSTEADSDVSLIPAAENIEEAPIGTSMPPPQLTSAPVQLQAAEGESDAVEVKETPEEIWNSQGQDALKVAKYLAPFIKSEPSKIIEMVDYLQWYKSSFAGALIDWIPSDGTMESLDLSLLSSLQGGMAYGFSSEDQVRKGRVTLALQTKTVGIAEDALDTALDAVDRNALDTAQEGLDNQETALTEDVGRGEPNNEDDVEYVKEKLFEMSLITSSERDSTDVNILHAIIIRYQGRIEAATIDGVVSKNGTSIQYLMAGIRGVAQSDDDRVRNIEKDEEIAEEIELGGEEVTEESVDNIINGANGNMDTLAATAATYLRANSSMVEQIVDKVPPDQQKELVTSICTKASEPALMSSHTNLLEKMYAIMDKGWTSEAQYTLMAKLKKVQLDPVSQWLQKEAEEDTVGKKNSTIAELVLEAEELGLIYFNPEGAGNFDSEFGGCKDTFLKFKNLETIGNGAGNSGTFDPNNKEAPILELTLGVLKSNVRDWIRKGKKSKPNLITLGSFMVWNTGDKAGRLRTTNHGDRAKAIDINVYSTDHDKVDFTQDGSEEKVYQIIRDLPSGTYEIGLPFQGQFFPATAAGGAKHTSKHTDGTWVYRQLNSQRLIDAFNELLESGSKLKIITDNPNHLHLAIGSGNGYMDKDNKDDNVQ